MMQPGQAKTDDMSGLPYALKVFLLLSVGLTFSSFVYTICCRQIGLGLPYSFPYYYVPGMMFSDFFDFHDKFSQWGTPAFFQHKQFMSFDSSSLFRTGRHAFLRP
jgi:hypothetical protein